MGKRRKDFHGVFRLIKTGRIHKLTPEERFWRFVEKQENCWLWRGGKHCGGYGQFKSPNSTLAHRFSYELHHGKIPKGLCVCHTCDNPPCVNPLHLWLGSIRENNLDRDVKGRHNAAWGEKAGNNKLKQNQVILIRELSKKGYVQTNLAKQFNVSQTLISFILGGRAWKNLKA